MNLYNLMINYAFIKVGVLSKTDATKRQQFFSQIKIQVGDDSLSFDDIEHGILRSNHKTPSILVTGSQFQSKNDSRISLSLHDIDHRVHFALNCGTHSCPPLQYFTGQAVNEELRLCGQEFCNNSKHVQIDEAGNELHVAQVFQWYKDDFLSASTTSVDTSSSASGGGSGSSKSQIDIPQVILQYLKGKKKSTLRRMVNGARDGDRPPIKIHYIPYDWSTYARKSHPFSVTNLKADVRRFSKK